MAGVMLSCLALGRAFYLPNLSGIFSKKTPCGATALSSLWGGGGCGGLQGVRNYYPYDSPQVALPYPMPVPAHPQVGATPQQPAGLSVGLQGGYGNTQLVPCLCSVSQEDIDDAGKLLTQQQAAKKMGGAK
ncbi:hypothetical protein PR048_022618 [Dryococelus australis]|uniref:Uncharacterized protein n=1 Tax=Dryococelus australis TaxID=614101 RepID=A0ABQ9H1S4_9NEOP|nr:hypothetical protein PR048_022618 [Dryococelus australis]